MLDWLPRPALAWQTRTTTHKHGSVTTRRPVLQWHTPARRRKAARPWRERVADFFGFAPNPQPARNQDVLQRNRAEDLENERRRLASRAMMQALYKKYGIEDGEGVPEVQFHEALKTDPTINALWHEVIDPPRPRKGTATRNLQTQPLPLRAHRRRPQHAGHKPIEVHTYVKQSTGKPVRGHHRAAPGTAGTR